jgi:4-diphosphocytidyl-2-C-methyl-D-erythritol kinase
MAPTGLADRLSLAPAMGASDTLHVSGPDLDLAALGPPADNLVLRAIAIARAAIGGARPTPALAARLDKRIPVAAGLAGGSSDAAAALEGALEAWGVGGETVLSGDELRQLASRLGSDVAFFLAGGLALVEGRGERVTGLPAAIRGEPPGILLVVPRLAISSATVFAAYAASGASMNGATRQTSEHLADELRRGLTARTLHDRAGILASANDLFPTTAAIQPALVPFRRALARLTGRPIGLSGSGPSLWVLYPSLEEAQAAELVVRSAIEAGLLIGPGDRPPFSAATTIVGQSLDRP